MQISDSEIEYIGIKQPALKVKMSESMNSDIKKSRSYQSSFSKNYKIQTVEEYQKQLDQVEET
jgi:hypothetical protein